MNLNLSLPAKNMMIIEMALRKCALPFEMIEETLMMYRQQIAPQAQAMEAANQELNNAKKPKGKTAKEAKAEALAALPARAGTRNKKRGKRRA